MGTPFLQIEFLGNDLLYTLRFAEVFQVFYRLSDPNHRMMDRMLKQRRILKEILIAKSFYNKRLKLN